mmetsp:Transcript_11495/g.20752  ORF Transcript_11495/g.20752 Transcript_11495/m.20752 type:complete len:254 (-) Transcript_11495:311-1072(-)
MSHNGPRGIRLSSSSAACCCFALASSAFSNLALVFAAFCRAASSCFFAWSCFSRASNFCCLASAMPDKKRNFSRTPVLRRASISSSSDCCCCRRSSWRRRSSSARPSMAASSTRWVSSSSTRSLSHICSRSSLSSFSWRSRSFRSSIKASVCCSWLRSPCTVAGSSGACPSEPSSPMDCRSRETSSCSSRMRVAEASSLTVTTLTINRVREAYRSVERVSSKLQAAGDSAATIVVRELPPRESDSSDVSIESR